MDLPPCPAGRRPPPTQGTGQPSQGLAPPSAFFPSHSSSSLLSPSGLWSWSRRAGQYKNGVGDADSITPPSSPVRLWLQLHSPVTIYPCSTLTWYLCGVYNPIVPSGPAASLWPPTPCHSDMQMNSATIYCRQGQSYGSFPPPPLAALSQSFSSTQTAIGIYTPQLYGVAPKGSNAPMCAWRRLTEVWSCDLKKLGFLLMVFQGCCGVCDIASLSPDLSPTPGCLLQCPADYID